MYAVITGTSEGISYSKFEDIKKAVTVFSSAKRDGAEAWLLKAKLPEPDVDLNYAIAKAAPPKRFTLGPLYSPNAVDAHGDFIDAPDLQDAAWNYVRKSDRTIRLQHNRDIVAGEVVELVTWPFEIEADLVLPDVKVSKSKTIPADTVFLGVVWEDWAWDLVQKGKLRGYSMGGRAKRIEVDFAAQ